MFSEQTIKATVHDIEPTKEFGKNGFQKRSMILVQGADSKYPNFIPIEFTRDLIGIPDGFNVGDEVEVGYRLSGRRWRMDESSEVRYFLSCEGLWVRPAAPAAAPEAPVAEAVTEDLPW